MYEGKVKHKYQIDNHFHRIAWSSRLSWFFDNYTNENTNLREKKEDKNNN